jgi:P pilus assembly chaperone PapD
VVQPNATQSFRIRYIGDQAIDRTRMYVISVNQLPVSTSEAQSLQFVVNFATAAYVTPQGLRPEIAVVSTEPGSDGRTVRVTVRNDGRKYASLALSTMTVRNAAGQSFSLEGDPLREALGLTVVPAGGTRVFTLPVPQNFTATGQVTTALRYDPLAGAN